MNALEMLNEICKAPIERSLEVCQDATREETPVKRIDFETGGSLSVQASRFTYCTPRDNEGPYTHVECGFPKDVRLPSSWAEYAEMGSIEDSDVFAYVPVTLVRELILTNCPSLKE